MAVWSQSSQSDDDPGKTRSLRPARLSGTGQAIHLTAGTLHCTALLPDSKVDYPTRVL